MMDSKQLWHSVAHMCTTVVPGIGKKQTRKLLYYIAYVYTFRSLHNKLLDITSDMICAADLAIAKYQACRYFLLTPTIFFQHIVF